MFKRILVGVSLIFLLGCIADQKNEAANAPQTGTTINVPAPTINIPPGQTVDANKVAELVNQKVEATTNNTQAQLSGLVTTQISKLTDSIKGVEANLNARMDNNLAVTTSLQSKIDITATNQVALQAKLESIINVNNKIETNLQAVNNMMAKIDIVAKLQAELEAKLNVQAGLMNLSKQITTTANAGRDVNFMPMNAVIMMIAIVILIATIAAITISLAYKAARTREADRTKMERDERIRLFNLLTEVLVHVPPDKARNVSELLNKSNLGAEVGHPQ